MPIIILVIIASTLFDHSQEFINKNCLLHLAIIFYILFCAKFKCVPSYVGEQHNNFMAYFIKMTVQMQISVCLITESQ